MPGQAPGREGMKPLIRGFLAAFPDTTITVHEIIGAPGRAAVRAEIAGTHRGEWFGMAPTGKASRLPIHEFHHTAAGTAWQALFEVADLQRGQTVLVHAGAGGVGSFAIHLARTAGARVVATASGAGIEVARQLGADQVIDYRSERFEDRLSDLDAVLDTVRDAPQPRSFGVLRPGGTLVSTTAPPDEALAKAHKVSASFVFHQSDGSRLEDCRAHRRVPAPGVGPGARQDHPVRQLSGHAADAPRRMQPFAGGNGTMDGQDGIPGAERHP